MGRTGGRWYCRYSSSYFKLRRRRGLTSLANPITIDDDYDDQDGLVLRHTTNSRSRSGSALSHPDQELQEAVYEVEYKFFEEKRKVQRLQQSLDDEAVRFQRERMLYEEKTQELLENLQAEATQRAKLAEALRVIQKEQYLDRERQLETKLAEVESTVRQLRERHGCQCAICYEAICDTVTACGHQFCWECFVSWHREQSQDLVFLYTCPLCRTAIGRRGDSALAMVTKLHKN